MICVFEISSPEAPDFLRIVHLWSEHSFEDLHLIIQKTCNFDHSQLASFFLKNNLNRKQVEITCLDNGPGYSNSLSMRKAKLNSYLFGEGQKFTYVFDFFNDRHLKLELKEILMKTEMKEPFVAYEKGNAPAQFLINDYDSPEVELLDSPETYKSFGDLEDYYEIFGDLDA
jgi:hypothetical protein